jgi:hypothetical protein
MLAALLLGCTAKNAEVDTGAETCSSGDTLVFVMNTISWARRDENDVVWGFDIDDLDSDEGDSDGCNHQDLEDPMGNTGIDNSISGLLPVMDLTAAISVEGLIQDSINTGELLLMLELRGFGDEPMDEDCIDVEILRGEGVPMVGTDGAILDHQTFSRSEDIASSKVDSVPMADGGFVAKPLSMELPVDILDKNLIFPMTKGGVGGFLHEDGEMHGYFGGAVPVEYVREVVSFDDVGAELTELMLGLLATAADIAPNEDGECQELSVAFEFTAIPAYLFSN